MVLAIYLCYTLHQMLISDNGIWHSSVIRQYWWVPDISFTHMIYEYGVH